ncbi:MAG: SUF system NifU family Fe-S cluster assembly protein [Thermorudis peleae]|nr:SUF system NifU family Fe-S cluster assembly protein [Thermorudis peleae]
MSDLYREHILDHYEHPRNYGTLDPADRSFEDSNPLCGDRIRIDLRIRDGKIAEIAFTGRGCAISQAAASILTEMVKGQDLEAVKQLTADDLLEELGIPISPARRKCALLSLKVLKAAAYGLNEWPS